MNVITRWTAGSASHVGRQRNTNEDRILVDEARGIFAVIDGLGGHAGGEVAAELALETLERERLHLPAGSEDAVRRVITSANNNIFVESQNEPNLKGMACVLTLAVVKEDQLTVGHVGDSRLYLLQGGQLQKITSDHSPVGEWEDGGQLEEQQAMRHPLRNRVFRDVGSSTHQPSDPDFIEITKVALQADDVVLLCSDGLSDVLTSAEITGVLEQYSGDANETARQLVDAANAQSGADNISVVLLTGPSFTGREPDQSLAEARAQHAITRLRDNERRWFRFDNMSWLLAGIILGILLTASFEHGVQFAKTVSRWLFFRVG